MPGQLKLFQVSDNGLNRIADPAFSENREEPIHRWVPWVAGFSAGFLRDVFRIYGPGSGKSCRYLVMDPFVGVGTSLIEAVRSGFDAVGFEINPFAAFVTDTKLRALGIRISALDRAMEQCQRRVGQSPKSSFRLFPNLQNLVPGGFRSRIPFYSPRVQEKVCDFLNFAHKLEHPVIRDLFLLAFGAVMVKFSNYTYEPSLGSRPAAGKPLVKDAPVLSICLDKLREIRNDLARMQKELDELARKPSAVVKTVSCMRCATYIEHASVDLVVTSPPYLNNYHYVRNTRPQMFWLGLRGSPKDLRQIEIENFGKFWQTVRDKPPLRPEFIHPPLERLIKAIRSANRDRRTYGGAGWANYVTAYFNDSYRFLHELQKVLKPRGIAVIVIGNSFIQGIEVQTDKWFAELAQLTDLRVVELTRIRSKRVGSSIVSSSIRSKSLNGNNNLYETAVVLTQ